MRNFSNTSSYAPRSCRRNFSTKPASCGRRRPGSSLRTSNIQHRTSNVQVGYLFLSSLRSLALPLGVGCSMLNVGRSRRSPSPDFRAMETDLQAEDFFHAALDESGGEVEFLRDFDAMEIDDGVIAALGKDVDQHGERQRVVEQEVFGIDECEAGNGMAQHDRHEL